jgi:hypothetical protein
MLIPLVVACTLTPPAEISAAQFTARYQYAVAACTEIPHPDHDAGGLTVDSVTGAPSEFSQVRQWATVPTWPAAIEKAEFSVLDVTLETKVQTRALGRTYWSGVKMRGR